MTSVRQELGNDNDVAALEQDVLSQVFATFDRRVVERKRRGGLASSALTKHLDVVFVREGGEPPGQRKRLKHVDLSADDELAGLADLADDIDLVASRLSDRDADQRIAYRLP